MENIILFSTVWVGAGARGDVTALLVCSWVVAVFRADCTQMCVSARKIFDLTTENV